MLPSNLHMNNLLCGLCTACLLVDTGVVRVKLRVKSASAGAEPLRLWLCNVCLRLPWLSHAWSQ